MMLHGDSIPADKAASTHPTSSMSKERGPVVHSLGCSQDPTTGLGHVRKELQSADREKKGKLRQESLGVLASFGYTNSENQNCCCLGGECCHTLEYGDCPSLVQMGGLGYTVGVYPQETCHFHPPRFSSLCTRKNDVS